MTEVSKMSDEQIVEIVRNKDKNRYAEIIHRYEKKLLRYAIYLITDEQLAADAVQEGFIKAYINLHSFNVSLRFSSWLYRIVHNEAMNLVRANHHDVMIDEALNIDSQIHVEDAFIKKELQNRVDHCLQQMSLLYKEPLVLFFLEEKTYQEISDILRIPIGTVGTRINRAKQLVRKICQKKA